MIVSGALIACVAVLVLAAAILWANPHRPTNRGVAFSSLTVAAWLFCLHVTLTIENEQGLPWLRLTTSVGVFIPYSLWLVKEAISMAGSKRKENLFMRGWGWLAASVFLAAIPYTDFFVPPESTSEQRIYGAGYYVYIAGFFFLCGLLLQRSYVRLRQLSGLPKLELQVWLLGGTGACLTVIFLMGLRTILQVPLNFQAAIVLIFFAWTAIAITTHRIFDARNILTIAAQRVLLLAIVTAAAWGFSELLAMVVAPWLVFVFTVAAMLWFSGWLNAKLDVWLLRYPKAVQARSAAFHAAHTEIRTEELRSSFRKVLNGWGQSDRSVLMIEDGEHIEGDDIELPIDGDLVSALEEIGWATPERLDRERETKERRKLGDFLREHELGAIAYEKGLTLRLVVGVGVRPSRRPFTYPEITQLRELASIFESSLSRTQLLAKAQRAEQLATVGLLGAGVAHEIRNPLVSIKTFAQLLPKHYDDPDFRVRFSRLIGEEVARIDRLTEQLLDLAAPRSYQPETVALHEVVQSSLDLVAARVSTRNVTMNTKFNAQPDAVWSDSRGLKQVVLNLCFNAVQAQENNAQNNPVELKLETRNINDRVELAVMDNGPGIPEEDRVRLFEPFHSTKSNGFGLGLTVCGEILSSLDSSIALDPYESGRGATFRISLPCPPHSS